jgi:Mrp family chromosome partitioning ATPase
VGSVVAVTHAHSRERTDAVAQQLVQAASRLGTAIVLDWRSLSATEDVGLSDYVANGELGVDDVIREVAPDLFAMSYGTVAGDPYAVLSSSRTAELLRQLRTSFQAVIIETPAVRQTVEGSVACTLADATVLAVDQRRSRSNEVADAAIDLARLRVRVGGVVLLLSGRGKQPHTSGWSGSARDHHADGRPESQISPESGAQPDPETEGEPAPLMHLPSNTGVSTADAEFDTESATSTDESQRSVQGHDELTGEKV